MLPSVQALLDPNWILVVVLVLRVFCQEGTEYYLRSFSYKKSIPISTKSC
jgi:hypothetical protein